MLLLLLSLPAMPAHAPTQALGIMPCAACEPHALPCQGLIIMPQSTRQQSPGMGF